MQEKLLHAIRNLISVGTVAETKSAEGKALARVNVCGRISDFLPVLSFANSYKRHFTPTRVGEEVVVFCPFGDPSSGVILGGIFNKDYKESEGGNDTKEVIVYEDGVRISYDSKSSTLEVKSPKLIHIECKDAFVKAQTIKCDCPSIDLGLGGQGVVTTECICAFTGAPHPHGSQNTRSKI